MAHYYLFLCREIYWLIQGSGQGDVSWQRACWTATGNTYPWLNIGAATIVNRSAVTIDALLLDSCPFLWSHWTKLSERVQVQCENVCEKPIEKSYSVIVGLSAFFCFVDLIFTVFQLPPFCMAGGKDSHLESIAGVPSRQHRLTSGVKWSEVPECLVERNGLLYSCQILIFFLPGEEGMWITNWCL